MRRCKIKVYFLILMFSSIFSYGQNPDQVISLSVDTNVEKLKPGDTTWIFIEVTVKPGWHAYWKTAGQTGFPTTIDWDLPSGISVGTLHFPTPQYYEFQGLGSYVHEDTFTLLAELSLSRDWNRDDPLVINGRFSTLVCDEANCIPFDEDISLAIEVGDRTILIPGFEQKLEMAKSNWPILAGEELQLSVEVNQQFIELLFVSPKFQGLPIQEFYFFPENEFFVHVAEQNFQFDENGTKLKLRFERDSSVPVPDRLRGVLSHPEFKRAFSVDLVKKNIQYGQSSDSEDFLLSFNSSEVEKEYKLLWLLLAFVLIGLAIWVYAKTNQFHHPKHKKNLGRALAFLILSFAVWLAFPDKLSDAKSIEWGQWSPELESALRKEGKAVYVDFTAKWCMVCQVNKRVFLSSEIVEKFEGKEIVALLADWTQKGPEILKALQAYGREGVPLNVFYPASGKQGIPMPEVLNEEILLNVLENERPYLVAEVSGFGSVLGFALLGGLILNLMPCVFPVLGLKIMSFVKQAGEETGKIKRHGIVFSLGVLISFWVLVGVLLALRESLQAELGWGFQLQEPIFVFVLAVFLFVFALSLSGLLEIGSSFGGVGSKISSSKGYKGSFFSGVLATVVATPCMAPFLGAAVGAALTMDWFSAYLVFSCIALGLASPYLTLSLYPAWISKLPKPGEWMDTFKQFMAFPLYATVAWLVWTLQSLL